MFSQGRGRRLTASRPDALLLIVASSPQVLDHRLDVLIAHVHRVLDHQALDLAALDPLNAGNRETHRVPPVSGGMKLLLLQFERGSDLDRHGERRRTWPPIRTTSAPLSASTAPRPAALWVPEHSGTCSVQVQVRSSGSTAAYDGLRTLHGGQRLKFRTRARRSAWC